MNPLVDYLLIMLGALCAAVTVVCTSIVLLTLH